MLESSAEQAEEGVDLGTRLPLGCPIEGTTRPEITSAHTKRLRTMWAMGRPMLVGTLGGMDLDLVVHGYAQTVEKGHGTTAVLTVTQRGVAFLNEVRQAKIASQRPHHALGERLATHLQGKGFYTWENVEFSNPDLVQPRRWGVVRPDVFACLPALKARGSLPAIYEVKVSRADFLADIARPEKREAYAQLAEAVYYCCPAGLIDKAEVPDGYGLLVEEAGGAFELLKKARRQKNFELHADTAMTLMVKRQVPIAPFV